MADDPDQPRSVFDSKANREVAIASGSGTGAMEASSPGVSPGLDTSGPSNPDSTSLAEHCRLAHFTLVSLCVAMLIALNADPDRRLTETINELDQAKLLQAHWQDLNATVSGVVSRDQSKNTKFQIFGTVNVDGSPLDVMINLDIQNLWVPFHSQLYNRTAPTDHLNKLVQPGVSANSLLLAWDWATDLQWIFVPTKPLPMMNIGRVQLETHEVVVEQTVRTEVQETAAFSQDQHRGKSKHLVMVDMLYWNTGFGVFPNEYSSEPNKGHLTISGSGGGTPTLFDQLLSEMHIDTLVSAPRVFARDKDRVLVEPHRIRSVTIKIPMSGQPENVAPMLALGRSLSIPITAAEKFNPRFPRIAALPAVYRELPIQQCRQVLDEQRTQLTQKSLSVAGLEIPLTFVVRWGQLIVIIAFAYFLTHVYELSRRLGENPLDEGWKAPWIALYQAVPGRIMTIASGFLLPMGIGLLTARHVLGAPGGQDKAMALVSATVLIAMSAIALVLFNRLASVSQQLRPLPNDVNLGGHS
jgi:hypothetical protein